MTRARTGALAYLSEGKATFDASIGGTSYRARVRELKRMAKELDVVLDIRTEDYGAEIELQWKIIDHIKCVNCNDGITVGQQITEVYTLSKIPLGYDEGRRMEIEKEFMGYKHLKCRKEEYSHLMSVMPIHGM